MTINQNIAILFFFGMVYFVIGLWFGMNLGIGMSLDQGPIKACHDLRFSILMCDTSSGLSQKK